MSDVLVLAVKLDERLGDVLLLGNDLVDELCTV